MDAVNKNLGELDIRTAHLFEVRLAHIKELAYEVAKRIETTAPDLNLINAVKASYQRARAGTYWDGIAENRGALELFGANTENLELAQFAAYVKECAQINKNLPISQFFSAAESISDSALGKIACMKNVYTDTAYARFARLVQKPSAIYLDSFTTICEEVAYGRCEYCILPIENSDDGKLFGFYKLLSQYELNIILTTRVELSEDSSSTCFALVKKGGDSLPVRADTETERYFEFCVIGGKNIGDICAAAQLFGITLHKIDCATRTYSENEFEYHVVFDVSSGDLYSFLIYLSLKTEHYSALGLYSKIN